MQVLARKDKPQALPDLSQSLYQLNWTPQPGKTYRIKIVYSNTVYAGDTDVDGVTLFAYSFDPTPTEAPDITLTFPPGRFRTNQQTQATVEVSGPPGLAGTAVGVTMGGPDDIAPRRFSMTVGSSRLVDVTLPATSGVYQYRASLDEGSALDEATVEIPVFGGFDGVEFRLQPPRVHDRAIDLSWNDIGADFYRVYWSSMDANNAINDGFFDVSSTQTSHPDLNVGTTYCYQVRAVFNGQERDATEQLCATITSAPDKPLNLSATIQDGQIILTWTASPTPDIQNYSVYRGTQAGATRYAGQTTGTRYVDDGLPAGTYWYAVEAVKNNIGSGQMTLSPPNVPGTPAFFNATGLDRKVHLQWGDSTGARDFRLRRRVQNTTEWTEWRVSGDRRSYDDTNNGAGLSNGTTYEYQLQGVNWGGTGSALGASATPRGEQTRERPSTPAPANAVAGDGYVTISWAQSQRANDYAIKRRQSDTQTVFVDIRTQPAANARTYVDRAVANGKTYEYRVVAINESGDSDPAGTSQVTPRGSTQPDAMIRLESERPASELSGSNSSGLAVQSLSDGNYSGDNIYNTLGTKQSRSASVPRNQSVVYHLRFQNDGKVNDTLVITGSKASDGWRVTYQDALIGGGDITTAVTGTGFRVSLAPGRYRDLRLVVTPTSSVLIGAKLDLQIKAVSLANLKQTDVIMAQTTAGSDPQIVVHPQAADFAAGMAGRIMISALHDQPADKYYTKQITTTANTVAQTADGKITITAYLNAANQPASAVANLRVYFRVIDPDDLSPYETDTLGNDNLPTGYKGQLSGMAATSHLVTINGRQVAAAEVVLNFNDCGGNNYQVEVSLDPTFPALKTSRSVVMVAWKRVYLEIDRMYGKGATLTDDFIPDADNDNDTLKVDNIRDFHVDADDPSKNDEIVIFKPQADGTIQQIIRKIKSKRVLVPTPYEFRPIVGEIEVEDIDEPYPALSGVKIQGADETKDMPTKYLQQGFGAKTDGSDAGAFIEFRQDVLSGWNIPRYSYFSNEIISREFFRYWFKTTDRRNVLMLASSCSNYFGDARAFPGFNILTVFQDAYAWRPVGERENPIAEVIVHETGHHFGLLNTAISHVDAEVNQPRNWNNTDACVMTYKRNTDDGIAKFDEDCLRMIRQHSGPINPNS